VKKAGLNALNLKGVSFIDAELHVMRRRLEERKRRSLRSVPGHQRSRYIYEERALRIRGCDPKADESGQTDRGNRLRCLGVVTDPQIPAEVIQETLRLAARIDPRLKQINVLRLFDMGFAAELEIGK